MFSDAIPKDLRISPPVRERWSASLQTLEGHYGPISMVVFSPDGQLVASSSCDHPVRLWNVQTGDSRALFKGRANSVWNVVFSPNGHFVAAISDDHTVRLWDAQTGDSRAVLKGHSDRVFNVVFSPDG
jgi:WD40 repeat protein